MYVSNDQDIIEIEGIYFIRLDLRGIKRAVNYNHKNKLYNTFISIIMIAIISQKYEIYLPVKSYPKIFYKIFRKEIIANTIVSKFNGIERCFSNRLQPWLFANAQWYSQNFGGFSFFDFSYLNFDDLIFRLAKKRT